MSNAHEPTSDGLEAPAPPPLNKPAAADPRELAKRLAAEARARLEQAESGTSAPAPNPPPPAPAPAPEPAPVEDKRALAQELAARARAKLQAAAPAAPETPAPSATSQAAPRRSLKDVAPTAKVGMSAQEALRAALAREAAAASEKTSPAPVSEPERRIPEPKLVSEPAPHSAPDTTVPTTDDPAAVVLQIVPNAYVKRSITVSNAKLFETLWRAHTARALNESDLQTVGTASVLLHANATIPHGSLCAVHFEREGTEYVAFVDAGNAVLLGILSPASPYLAGL